MQNRLTNPKTIQTALAGHGFRFSKKAGQNFLINPAVPERMAGLFDCGQAVLEIGPGFGALTWALCQTAGAVIAVEADHRLLPLLESNLHDCPNLTLVEADALRLDLDSLFPAGLQPVACANLPYSITSPLLVHLLGSCTADPVVVMVQREVADRIRAGPGTPEYGAFTLFCRMYADCELLFAVGPENFLPRPRVQSAVIRFSRHKAPAVPAEHRGMVTKLYKAAFAQRRKTLQNALAAGTGLPRDTVARALTDAGIDPMRRGETLSLQEYLEIAKNYYKSGGHHE